MIRPRDSPVTKLYIAVLQRHNEVATPVKYGLMHINELVFKKKKNVKWNRQNTGTHYVKLFTPFRPRHFIKLYNRTVDVDPREIRINAVGRIVFR